MDKSEGLVTLADQYGGTNGAGAHDAIYVQELVSEPLGGSVHEHLQDIENRQYQHAHANETVSQWVAYASAYLFWISIGVIAAGYMLLF